MPSDSTDVYQDTVSRFEPEIHHMDESAWGTSLAISAKRIADSLTVFQEFLLKSREEVIDDSFRKGFKKGQEEMMSRYDFPDTTGQ